VRPFLNKYVNLLMLSAWLVTLGIIINNYWSDGASLNTVRNKLNAYVQEQEKSVQRISRDTALTGALLNGVYDADMLERTTGLPYALFLYKKDLAGQYQLRFWNTQQVAPGTGLLFMEKEAGCAFLGNAFYVWNIRDIPGGKALALIPVKWNYPVTNEYLKNNFALSGISSEYDLKTDSSGKFSVTSMSGQVLFSVVRSGSEVIRHDNALSVVLLIVAALLLLFFIHFLASFISSTYGFWKGLVFFILIVGGLRLLSYFLPIPLNFRQYELFDPSVYGSGPILRSLGDLLINAALFVWFVMFMRFQLREQKVSLPAFSPGLQ